MNTLSDFRRDVETKIFEERPSLSYSWGPEVEPPFMRFRLYHRWIRRYKFKSLKHTFEEVKVGPDLVLNDLGIAPSSTLSPFKHLEGFCIVDQYKVCGQIMNVIVDEVGISAEGVVYDNPSGEEFKRLVESSNFQLRPRILTTSANFAREPTMNMMRLIAIDIDTSAPAIENSFIEIIQA